MKIKEWFDGFQTMIDFILIGCGFSPHNEAQVEQTATEIKSKNQTTTDTIRLLKQLRLDQWTRVHDKLWLYMVCETVKEKDPIHLVYQKKKM